MKRLLLVLCLCGLGALAAGAVTVQADDGHHRVQ